tara:strand:- start:9 stop:608 length:600 start_codon:yes stop_codon:yes gene_type:complete
MKVSLILSYGIYLTGFLLKFFHLHFNAILMLIGLAGILVTGLFLVSKKESRPEAFLHLTGFVWLALLFCSVKFLPFQSILLIVASILSVFVLIAAIRERKLNQVWFLGIIFLLALSFYLIPTHKRYHLLSIRWNHEIETDYITWDKYSWFLYQNEKFEEAYSASEKAKNIAYELEDETWMEFIEQHQQAIVNRSWSSYR